MSAYKTYTLDNNSVIKWRRSIDGYYKRGLEQFSDAQTVRIMLRMADDWISKDEEMVESIRDSADPQDVMDWIETFGEERVAMKEIRAELDRWLQSRGLTD